MRFGFVDAEKANFPVRVLCQVLQISVSGYYAWCGRGPSRRAKEDEVLRVHIRAAHKASRGRYGSPRVHRELRAQDRRISRKRVARLMKLDGLVARCRRRFRCTTDSKQIKTLAPPPMEHLLRREGKLWHLLRRVHQNGAVPLWHLPPSR